MRAWFLRNAVALAVIVVAAPTLVGVLLGLRLLENSKLERPPIEVAAGETVEFAGYTWTLVASGEFPHGPDNAEVPEGLAVTAAIIEVRPAADPRLEGSCEAELTSHATGSEQRWPTLSRPREFNYALGEDTTTLCLFDGEPFDLEVVYLTPEGTSSAASVEVEMGAYSGDVLRFALID